MKYNERHQINSTHNCSIGHDKTIGNGYRVGPLQLAMIAGEMSPDRWQRDFVQIHCGLDEPIDVAVLRDSLDQLTERHESLRAEVSWRGDKEGSEGRINLCQASIALDVINLEGATETGQSARIDEAIAESWHKTFDVSKPPRFWATLIRYEETRHRLVITYQETVLDEHSGKVLVRELFELYDQASRGDTQRLPAATPFHDYQNWLATRDNGENCHFWRDLLEAAPAPSPPPLLGVGECDHSVKDCCGNLMRSLSEESTCQLKEVVSDLGCSLNTALLAAWSMVIAHHCGEEDIRFSSVFSERTPSYTYSDSAVAMCFSVLPLITRGIRKLTRNELIETVRDQEMLLKVHSVSLGADHTLRRLFGHPSSQSLVFFDEIDVDDYIHRAHPDWTHRRFQLFGRNPYAIAMRGFGGERMRVQAWYNPSSYGRDAVNCLLDQLVYILEILADNCNQPIYSYGLCPKQHSQHINQWSRGEGAIVPALPVHDLIEEQVQQTPDALAVIDDDNELTYQQLSQRANQVSRTLLNAGLNVGETVGICMGRSTSTVVAVLGVLKAGGVYVPIDRSWPAERIVQALSMLNTRMVITDECCASCTVAFVESLNATCTVIQLSGPLAKLTNDNTLWITPDDVKSMCSDNCCVGISPDDTAYVIFTSGSTGKPKGVKVQHRPLINLINWARNKYGFGVSDQVLWVTSLGFDLSVFDLFGLLACGGSIRVASDFALQSPERLLEILTSESITFWNSAPQALSRIQRYLERSTLSSHAEMSQLRLVFLSGDWIPLDLPDAVRKYFPMAHVISLGGATEATVWSNYYLVNKLQPGWKSVPYGRPIQNANYYILDEQLYQCGVGVPGELYIGGDVLAQGYANDDLQTKQRFKPDPFIDDSSAKMYQTGDQARWWPDGTIELLGRLDNQVKIRGYRIELGEINAVLSRHPNVQDAIVIARGHTMGDKTLVAYVVAGGDTKISYSDLRSHLQRSLPDYMIPTTFVELDSLPLTSNGKVDQQSLPAPDSACPLREHQYEAPRSEKESRLAKIFGRVLRNEQVGIKDNFITIGGDSLSALDVIFSSEQAGMLINLDMLRTYTVEELARNAEPSLPQMSHELSDLADPVPLSPSQHWLFGRKFEEPSAYAFTAWLHARVPVNSITLTQAWRSVVDHHDALRICFQGKGNNLSQFVAPSGSNACIDCVDLRNIQSDRLSETIEEKVKAIWQSASLQDHILSRLVLIQIPGGEDLLFIFIPHIITDEYSSRVVIEDLETAYSALRTGRAVNLPSPTTPFAQWCRHLIDYTRHPESKREHESLVALPWDRAGHLPRDLPHACNQYESASDHTVSLSVQESTSLLDAARILALPMESLLVSALAQCLSDWSKNEFVAIDITGNGRGDLVDSPPTHRSVGYFSVIYPVLLNLPERMIDATYIRSIHEQLRKAPAQGARYGILKHLYPDSHIRETVARIPQPEIKLNYHGTPSRSNEERSFQPINKSLPMTLRPTDHRAYLINLEIYFKQGRFMMAWKFSNMIHKTKTINQLAYKLQRNLSQCIDISQENPPHISELRNDAAGFEANAIES